MSSLGRAESEFAHLSTPVSPAPVTAKTDVLAAVSAPADPAAAEGCGAPGAPADAVTSGGSPGTGPEDEPRPGQGIAAAADGAAIHDRMASWLSDLTTLHELGGRLAGAATLEEALHELLDAGGALLGARRGMVVIAGRPTGSARPGGGERGAASRRTVSAGASAGASGGASAASAARQHAGGDPVVAALATAAPDLGEEAFGSVLHPGTVVGYGLDRSALGALETVPLPGGPFGGLLSGGAESHHPDLLGLATAAPAPATADGATAADPAEAAGPAADSMAPVAPRYREVARQLGIASSYALPLAVEGEPPFGAAVWFHDEPTAPTPRLRRLARHYCSDAGRQLAKELDRQRLLRTTAALRDGLLPDRLPDVPRLRLAARCLPAGLDLADGSDWYDAIPLPDGTVGLTVGSVSGNAPGRRDGGGSADARSGAGAAAAMGRLRSALRAYAVLEGEDPVSVLGDLELLLKTTEPSRSATALYAVVDPASRRIALAGAGQCPPLLVTNYGASFVETSLSAPLGMLSCWEAPSVELRADRGDLLVLYTEGLARRSGGSLHTGQARLRAAAADAPHALRQDPERFCAHLLGRCLDGTGGGERGSADDLVMLVARFQ